MLLVHLLTAANLPFNKPIFSGEQQAAIEFFTGTKERAILGTQEEIDALNAAQESERESLIDGLLDKYLPEETEEEDNGKKKKVKELTSAQIDAKNAALAELRKLKESLSMPVSDQVIGFLAGVKEFAAENKVKATRETGEKAIEAALLEKWKPCLSTVSTSAKNEEGKGGYKAKLFFTCDEEYPELLDYYARCISAKPSTLESGKCDYVLQVIERGNLTAREEKLFTHDFDPSYAQREMRVMLAKLAESLTNA